MLGQQQRLMEMRIRRQPQPKLEVLLQTAITYAHEGSSFSPISVCVLLDSGSQRTYITNSLKKRLGLVPIRTETLNLNTFGNEHFTKQQCDMVQLSLTGKNGNRNITALCFPKICSPLTTTIDLNLYPHLQDLQLSDIDSENIYIEFIDSENILSLVLVMMLCLLRTRSLV